MQLQLGGRRALITGGSKGIGLACAHGLAAEGVNLAIAARTVGPLKDATRLLRDTYDIEVTSHSCDLSRSDHQQALAEVVGPVDILVNNAGTIPVGDLHSVDEAEWRQAWDLKVFGYLNLCRLVLPTMVNRGSGVIVNLIGAAADGPLADQLAGVAGRSALESSTAALGATSALDGVRVVGVTIPGQLDEGSAARVADVVSFLASDRASMVSGTVLTVDGGAGGRRETRT